VSRLRQQYRRGFSSSVIALRANVGYLVLRMARLRAALAKQLLSALET
jgi:hypothetical protein